MPKFEEKNLCHVGIALKYVPNSVQGFIEKYNT